MTFNGNIIKAVTDKTLPEMQLEDELYKICKEENHFCNANCPVYFLNGYRVPDNDKNGIKYCSFCLSGAKMRIFIEDEMS